MEENTVVRHFGALNEANGLVCWKILPGDEYDAGGYCNWSGCNGNAEGGWACNLNEHECEAICSGSWCPTSPTPPVVPPITDAPVISPATDAPVKSPTQPPVISPATDAPVKSPTQPPAPSGGQPCCSWDLKNCSDDAWCNQSETNCKGSW